MYRIWVKAASLHDAMQDAVSRGFSVFSGAARMRWHEVTLEVTGTESGLVQWFSEPSELTDGEGYADGTLLLYSDITEA